MLAEVLNRNEFDPHFLGQLIQIVMLTIAIIVGIKAIGRRPPMDVALANLANGLERAADKLQIFESQLDGVHDRLNDGDRIMSAMQAQQAASEAWREHFSIQMHEVKTQTATILARLPHPKDHR